MDEPDAIIIATVSTLGVLCDVSMVSKAEPAARVGGTSTLVYEMGREY